MTLLSCSAIACKHEQAPFIMLPLLPYERIAERGIIDACVYHNATDYYLHEGTPRGFHHELLNDFADHMGLKLHVEIDSNFDTALQGLKEDHYDLVAMSLCVTPQRQEEILFSDPLFHTRWVLVQNTTTPPLHSPHQLAGREIACQPGGEGKRLLEHLRDSLRLSFSITEREGHTYEDILLLVEQGEIPLAITTEHVARVAKQQLTRLDYSLALSAPLPVAWACPREAGFLLSDINHWLAGLKKNGRLAVLHDRYFNRPHHARSYFKSQRGTISPYDPIIQEHARRIDWDWRLLAALIYQESRFKPDVISGFGAVGLMQVMPQTATTLGYSTYLSPRDNIRVGIAYLQFLQNTFSRYPFKPEERTKFILAAYNAGPGHVIDAMKLAEAHHKDSYTWEGNVDYFLLNKSDPALYKHALAHHGYCDGKQVFNFVNNIIETYAHYKNIIPE
jgi:membrane-bound lytic murein transglycosylase F